MALVETIRIKDGVGSFIEIRACDFNNEIHERFEEEKEKEEDKKEEDEKKEEEAPKPITNKYKKQQ